MVCSKINEWIEDEREAIGDYLIASEDSRLKGKTLGQHTLLHMAMDEKRHKLFLEDLKQKMCKGV